MVSNGVKKRKRKTNKTNESKKDSRKHAQFRWSKPIEGPRKKLQICNKTEHFSSRRRAWIAQPQLGENLPTKIFHSTLLSRRKIQVEIQSHCLSFLCPPHAIVFERHPLLCGRKQPLWWSRLFLSSNYLARTIHSHSCVSREILKSKRNPGAMWATNTIWRPRTVRSVTASSTVVWSDKSF